MRKQMYSLLDHTAQVFLNPLSFTNDAEAIRWFSTVVNNKDEKTNISQYPHHFTLYRLADYDDKTGTYHARDEEKAKTTNEALTQAPKQIITGVQVQDEETKKFTVQELITMLKTELHTDNVVNIAEQKEA